MPLHKRVEEVVTVQAPTVMTVKPKPIVQKDVKSSIKITTKGGRPMSAKDNQLKIFKKDIDMKTLQLNVKDLRKCNLENITSARIPEYKKQHKHGQTVIMIK